jgi:hypothetical protein
VSDVIFIEIFAVIDSFEPELAQGFSLRIWPHNAVHGDKSWEADTVEAVSVKDSCSISDTLGKI